MSLPKENDTDISILIQAGNRGENTENLDQKDRQNSDLIHQRVPNLPTVERQPRSAFKKATTPRANCTIQSQMQSQTQSQTQSQSQSQTQSLDRTIAQKPWSIERLHRGHRQSKSRIKSVECRQIRAFGRADLIPYLNDD